MSLPGSEQDTEGSSNRQNSAEMSQKLTHPAHSTQAAEKNSLRELTADDDDADNRLLPLQLTYGMENVSVESHNPPTKSKEVWSDCELKSLTESVLFHTSGDSWPSHKLKTFWNSASEYVKHRGGASNTCRSGMWVQRFCVYNNYFVTFTASACRSKVTTWLAKRYKQLCQSA